MKMERGRPGTAHAAAIGNFTATGTVTGIDHSKKHGQRLRHRQ